MTEAQRVIYKLSSCGTRQKAFENSSGGFFTQAFLDHLGLYSRQPLKYMFDAVSKRVKEQSVDRQAPELQVFGQAREGASAGDLLRQVKTLLIVAPSNAQLPGQQADIAKVLSTMPRVVHRECRIVVVCETRPANLPEGAEFRPFSHSAAKEAIRSLFEQDHDVCWFFSGHGQRCGADGEVLCCGDDISDDELAGMHHKFLSRPGGHSMLEIIDSCHSAGLPDAGDMKQAAEPRVVALMQRLATSAASGCASFLKWLEQDWGVIAQFVQATLIHAGILYLLLFTVGLILAGCFAMSYVSHMRMRIFLVSALMAFLSILLKDLADPMLENFSFGDRYIIGITAFIATGVGLVVFHTLSLRELRNAHGARLLFDAISPTLRFSALVMQCFIFGSLEQKPVSVHLRTDRAIMYRPLNGTECVFPLANNESALIPEGIAHTLSTRRCFLTCDRARFSHEARASIGNFSADVEFIAFDGATVDVKELGSYRIVWDQILSADSGRPKDAIPLLEDLQINVSLPSRERPEPEQARGLEFWALQAVAVVEKFEGGVAFLLTILSAS